MRLETGFRIAPNWPKMEKITMMSQFTNVTSWSNFFDVVLFLLSILVTCPNFMSISSLVLWLQQFPFIRDWPEIRKSEICLSEFCPISGDWCKIGIQNLTRMLLLKCYLRLQIAKGYSFDRFWVIKAKPTSWVFKTHKVSMNQKVSTIKYKNC